MTVKRFYIALPVLVVVILACWVPTFTRRSKIWDAITKRGRITVGDANPALSPRLAFILGITNPIEVDAAQLLNGNEVLASIWGEPQLEVIRLVSSNLTDNGFSASRSTPRLRSLVVSDNPISDSAISIIASSKTIEVLNIANTDISDKSGTLLAALPRLRLLDASGTTIEDRFLEDLALSNTLQHINLSQTQVSDHGLKQVPRSVQELLIRDCKRVTSVVDLPASSALRFIDAAGTRITDGSVSSLSQLRRLERISVARTQVDGTGFKDLAELAHLSSVDLSLCPLSSEGISALAALPKLGVCSLANCDLSHIEIARRDKAWMALEILDLSGALVSVEQITTLAQAPRLKILDLRRVILSGPEWKHIYATLPRLTIRADK